MKRLSKTLLLMLVLAMCTGLTSCELFMGGNDNPVPAPTPTPTPTPETIVKATDLLKEAQKEGANVVFWYHYEGGLFYAVFKKVGDVYVYQEGGNCNKASTRGSVVETQLTTELLKLKGDGADLGFNVYSADDAGNKNDPIILCKVYSSTAEVEQKTNSPDNYLAAMAANIQNISMKTIMDDVKDIFNGDNKEYQPDNKNHDLENVLILTFDENNDRQLFKSLPEIEKNAAEQGISPEKAIGATIDNLKQNVKEKYEDGTSKIDKTINKAPGSISYSDKDAQIKKTLADDDFTIELEKVGDALVSYSSSNTNVATVNAKTGEVSIVAEGKTTITATVEDTEFYHYETTSASYELEVVEPESNGALEDYNRNDATEQ